ncbi:MAG: ATP-dependent DNA helicase [Actinomycetaceae bacterium]|nr:ATP-dependent DNA helicase [Actinomycetaceae bacterium]
MPKPTTDEGEETLDQTTFDVLDAALATLGGGRREGQDRMVAETLGAIQGREHLMIQAGTGTGKSLGYLVPTATWCATAGKRAVISTATLALQRQITAKDAPLVTDAVAEVTGVHCEVAVLKGWANYLCLYRATGGFPSEGTLFEAPTAGAGTSRSSGPTSELGAQVLRLREWAATTDTGDRDDLMPGVTDAAWRQVSVSRRECLGRSCPMVAECFPMAAREAANAADIVVTNHSLLGISATGNAEILPNIDLVVVDEAHELADRVREQASTHLSAASIARAGRRLRTHAKLDTTALEAAGQAVIAACGHNEAGLITLRPELLTVAMRVFDDCVRLAVGALADSSVDAAAKALARGALDELEEFCDAWSREEEHSITWVNTGDDGAQELVVAPLDVAGPIAHGVFGKRAAVLTSATLSLGDSFDAVAYQCGLPFSGLPWRGVDVGTPFDAARQGILYVAEHLPEPSPAGPTPQALTELVELVQASGGGALVLFSSWKGAEAGAEALRERTNFDIFLQGEEPVAALVEHFRADRDSCLVGTKSLWQGVDVPGPACRLVVIDRIPFPHPEDPIVKARSLDAERRRRSGFWEVSVTSAALLMAQGAGRLLRSLSDQGVVAILDRRLRKKSYGAYIAASLPKFWPTSDPELVRGALQRLSQALK